MRMLHYFGGLAALSTLALLATAASGFAGAGERHLEVGLVGAVLGVATHTLLIVFMIVTGRILKEAVRVRDLSPTYLEELNAFFAKKRAYPAAILGAFSVVVTGVLGMTARGFELPAGVHWSAGLVSLALHLYALLVGISALSDNQDLLDRTAQELERLEVEEGPVDALEPTSAFSPRATWLVAAVSAWAPYLYWSLVVWKGAFARVPAWAPLLSAGVSALFLWNAWRSEEMR